MDIEVARWLTGPDAAASIREAHGFDDPSSLKAGAALRRTLSPDRAAAVADLEWLRRRGAAKLGDMAASLFLTHDGLEQATRFPVAQWRAGRLSGAATRMIDAGCGLGIDALAARMAGIEVIGIEKDPVTAIFARANLGTVPGPAYEVRTADLKDLNPEELPGGRGTQDTAIFLDPARRTEKGRSWKVDDLSPSWDSILGVLGHGFVVVKLAPGFPRRLLPAGVDVTWVSHKKDLVETTLWSWAGATGRREAVVLNGTESRLLAGGPLPSPAPVSRYVYEPDPAVIRAGATGVLARMAGVRPVADSIAYLTGPDLLLTDFADVFEVLEILDFSEKALRAWVRDQGIGTLEIKVRGLGVDPAVLRRALRPKGANAATIILTPTTDGAKALVVRRIR